MSDSVAKETAAVVEETAAVEAALAEYAASEGDPVDAKVDEVVESDVYSTQEAIDDGLLVEPMQHSFPKCVISLSVEEAIKKSSSAYSTFEKTAQILKDAVLLVTRRWNSAKNIGMTDVEATEQVRVMQNCLAGNETGRPLLIALNELDGLTIMYPEDFSS